MTKKPAFWIAFAFLSVSLGVFAVTCFSEAFPLVTLDLEMDREGALTEARRLADVYGWGPSSPRQAASFGLEDGVQSYVELEGGGKEAFGEMIRGDLFSPYAWEVRHFQPGETTETLIAFTPAGEPYGFQEILPEDQPGASLDEASARGIAEEWATGNWRIDLGAYDPVEASQEIRPGGRTDHTFVYERRGIRVGDEGRYRLRLAVSGDRFTGLGHFVKVPEGFSRRFEEMRSANNTIAMVASMVLMGLFLGVGCGVGLFYLFRLRWVLWKAPLAWGLFVAFLQFLVGLNQWPLAWMGYDTAVSTVNFTLLYFGMQAAGFVGYTLFFTLIFMGAESLTRRAFPHHIQLWRSWSPDVAGSPQILGRTVAGYLLVTVFFAYEVVLYFISHRLFGWWSPSDALLNPDALATYLPWVPAIALSLQAGFWEECLFRAVPLAGAALLGKRFGHTRLWIGFALVLQALVFAAGHANYPNQPSYARLVELVLPALGFGWLYLRYGLLTVVVLHFAYDVVWFALPIFVADTPGIWAHQALVVLLALVPLLVVLLARWRTSGFRQVEEEAYNRGWTPLPRASTKPEAAPLPARLSPPTGARWGLLGAGALGLVLWIASQPFTSLAPRIEIDRGEAVRVARAALSEQGIELADPWRVLSVTQAGTGVPHRFVWREAGEEAFRSLLGQYLADPRWWVRFARWDGEVAARAEEYHVWVSGQGEVTRQMHRLPEERGGADLAEEQARKLAGDALLERYGLDTGSLREVSVAPEKLPQRRDWTITWKDPASFSHQGAEARVAVRVAGDEVAHTGRFIHLPESWEREERNRETLLSVVRVFCGGTLILGFFVVMVLAVIRWTRGQLAVGLLLRFGGLMLAINLFDIGNRWPGVQVGFSTAQPFFFQALMFVVAGLVGVIFVSLGLGLVVGMVQRSGDLLSLSSSGFGALVPGVALGLAAVGLASAASRFGPASDPAWADFGSSGGWSPLLGTAVGPLSGLVTGSVLFLMIFLGVDTLTGRWSRHRGLGAAFLLVVGWVLAGTGDVASIPLWLAAGTVTGGLLLAAYVFVLRHDLTLIPVAVAVALMLGAARDAVLRAYPGALPGSLIGIVLTGALAVYWFRKLREPSYPGAQPVAPSSFGGTK